MKLILLRHAQQISSEIPSGESPGISLNGKKRQSSTNQYLQEHGWSPACVYTSPVRRAVETAHMVGKCFSCPVVVEEALGNDFREEVLLKIIQEETREIICFVGHAPTLSDFARLLVGETPIPDIGRSSALILDVSREAEQIRCQPLMYITSEGVDQRFETAEEQF
jgi:phosphohistidine phosphatase SixA